MKLLKARRALIGTTMTLGIVLPIAVGATPAHAVTAPEVAKTHVGSFPRGGTGSYTITISNPNPDTLESFTVLDELPTGLTPTSVAMAPDGFLNCNINLSLNSVACVDAGGIGGNATAELIVNVDVAADAPCNLTNRVTVQDGLPQDPEHEYVVVVEDPTRITGGDCPPSGGRPTVTKTHSGSFTRGGTGQYQISVANQGSEETPPLFLSDTLPTGMTVSSVTTTPAFNCPTAAGASTVSCSNAGGLLPGATATVTVNVNIAADAACVTAVNVAEVSDAADPNQGTFVVADDDSVAITGCGSGGGGSILPINLNGIFSVYNNINTANNINSPGAHNTNRQTFR